MMRNDGESSSSIGEPLCEEVDGGLVERLTIIAGHIRTALALADRSDDPLIGVKLCDCLIYIDGRIEALGRLI